MKMSKALNKKMKRIQIEDTSSDSEVEDMVQTIDSNHNVESIKQSKMKTSKALNKNKKRIQIEDTSSDSEEEDMVQTIDDSDSEVSVNESETEQSTISSPEKKSTKIPVRKPEILNDIDSGDESFMRELSNETQKRKGLKRKVITYGNEGEQSNSKTTEKKMKTDITLPSLKDFMEKVEREKPLKWKKLNKKEVYIVESIMKTTIDNGKNKKRHAFIGTFIDKEKQTFRVWLPGTASKALSNAIKENVEKERAIVIRPLGEKLSERTNRTYQNFVISYY